uniref:Uncharacterized protein n=1 Tax=Sarcophilus harrisii TaxID=9305 RepID=A0A7N4PTP9_SARHA
RNQDFFTFGKGTKLLVKP